MKKYFSQSQCWIDPNRKPTPKGYVIWAYADSNRSRAAHRVVYEWFHGSVPTHLDIDHLCKNRACYNPHHLEPVSRAENNKRSDTHIHMRDALLAMTHCRRGHEFIPDNTYIRKDTGARQCRQCAYMRRKGLT